jgi:parallel beta-helix repeat protein
MTYVSSAAELLTALASATAGTTILLAPGNYGDLNLNAQFSGEVTIKSADLSDLAVFTSVSLNNVKNLTFDTVKFDYVWNGQPEYTSTVYINDSSSISINNSVFDGDIAQGTGTYADGYGTGQGVQISNSTDVTIDDNEFFNLFRGISFGSSQDIKITGNDIHDIRSDGIVFAQVNNVLIDGNYIHDFHVSESSPDHPDMIQMWTVGTTSPSTDITITNNFLNSGSGDYTQTIFMRNELVDQNQAGEKMFYQDIRVANNVIYNSFINAIYVGETDGLKIKHNTLLQNPDFTPDPSFPDPNHDIYLPTIHYADASKKVNVSYNVLPEKYNPPLSLPIDYVADGMEVTIGIGVLVQDNSAIFSDHRGSALINDGTIFSSTDFAVQFVGDDSSIVNNGNIWGYKLGVYFGGTVATLNNHGSIYGYNDAAVFFSQASDQVDLNNDGEIFGHDAAVRIVSDNDGGVIYNAGTIRSEGIGISINTDPGLVTTIHNDGVIQGASGAISLFAGGLHLDNRGMINGGIFSNAADQIDVVVNRGKIDGEVFLGSGNDTFRGKGSGTSGHVFGDAGDDKLIGGKENDTLDGGADSDLLRGGRGKDKLFGGPDDDSFDFNSIKDSVRGSKRDKVKDFVRGDDEIDLKNIDAKKGVSGNQKFKWINKHDFHDKKGELRYEDKHSKVIVQGDVDGDGKPDFEILVKVDKLGSDDFVL